MFRLIRLVALSYLVMTLFVAVAWPGTTGKIAGRVVDKSSGAAISGANVMLDGTTLGAAADLEGYFTILNVPPGNYRLKATMIGYGSVVVQDVRVEIDRTTKVDITMQEEMLAGEEVTVIADRPLVQPDVATSVTAISIQEVETLPLNTVTEVVSLQAGVEAGLVIRGAAPTKHCSRLTAQRCATP